MVPTYKQFFYFDVNIPPHTHRFSVCTHSEAVFQTPALYRLSKTYLNIINIYHYSDSLCFSISLALSIFLHFFLSLCFSWPGSGFYFLLVIRHGFFFIVEPGRYYLLKKPSPPPPPPLNKNKMVAP